MTHRSNPRLRTSLALALAATLFTAAAHASPAGEAPDGVFEPMSASSTYVEPAYMAPVASAYELKGDVVAPELEAQMAPMSLASRDAVKADYAEASEAGITARAGEIAEPRSVLAARSAYNADMALEMVAAQALEADTVIVGGLDSNESLVLQEGDTIALLDNGDLVVIRAN